MTFERLYLKDYKKPDFLIKNTHLYFNLYPQKTTVTATTTFVQNSDSYTLVLHGQDLKLVDLWIDDRQLTKSDYSVNADTLTLHKVPSHFVLKSIVEINPEANSSCEGLYYSKNIFSTQCEAESFRKITYFLDRPDVLTSYTVEIEADKSFPVLLSNGNCIDKKDLENNRHWSKWVDPFKKPCYLFALVAGDLGVITDNYVTKSGRNIKLEIYAPHGKQHRCQHAMVSLKKSMKWDEDRFNLEYDLDQYMIVSNDDFNMGAMENKGLNIFNSKLILADDKTATDDDFHLVESVIGHEYFHNWTGNRVTCRNWFELSLKEGLTVYRDQEFSADMNSRGRQRIMDVDSLRTRQFSEDAGPNAHPVRPESCLAPDNFYTATIYEKGAEVIRMMATLVGKEGFAKGMAEYFKRHDGQAVTIDDFAAAISEPNGQDFTQFKLWYSQAGTPQITVHEKYDHEKQTYTINLTQDCDLTVEEKQSGKVDKHPFVIPLKFGLITQNGENLKLSTDILILNQKNQSWTFDHIQEKPVLSLNREFSAPVKVKPYLSDEQLIHLMKYDTDHFNRRESCMTLLLTEVKRLISSYTNKENLIVKKSIIDSLGFILNDQKIDSSFKELILGLPSDQILAQDLSTIDGTAFWAAKKSIIQQFVKTYENHFVNQFNTLHKKNTSQDRALCALLLKYLVIFDADKYSTIALDKYKNSTNMTETLYALEALNTASVKEREWALNDFYQKWKTDAVVFMKWLTLYAQSRLTQTFDDVIKCSQDPAFDNKNPNSLYALHRSFSNNFYALSNSYDKAYTWLADEIIRVDSFNPQVAARLAAAFNFNAKLPDPQKAKANTEVKRILSQSQLSKNTKELLEKVVF